MEVGTAAVALARAEEMVVEASVVEASVEDLAVLVEWARAEATLEMEAIEVEAVVAALAEATRVAPSVVKTAANPTLLSQASGSTLLALRVRAEAQRRLVP